MLAGGIARSCSLSAARAQGAELTTEERPQLGHRPKPGDKPICVVTMACPRVDVHVDTSARRGAGQWGFIVLRFYFLDPGIKAAVQNRTNEVRGNTLGAVLGSEACTQNFTHKPGDLYVLGGGHDYR